MLDIFAGPARQVIIRAQDEALSLGHDYIGTEDLLTGAEDTFGPGSFVFPRPAFTARAEKALELSVTQAQALGHGYAGTGHILLDLLADGDGIAVRIVTAAGVDAPEPRSAIMARIAG